MRFRHACLEALLLVGTMAHAEKGDWRASVYFQESSINPDLTTRSDYRDVWLWSNTGMQPGMEIRYRNYGVALTPRLFGSMQDDPHQPPSRYEDYKLFYYGGGWGGEGFYQKFQGLYSDPPTGNARLLHQGMTVDAVVLNAYYAPLNPWFPESQVRNLRDGLPYRDDYERGAYVTPLLFLSGSRHSMNADKPFLESLAGAENSAFGTMSRVTTHSVMAGGMVVFNTLFYGLYFDPSLGFGAGYQRNDADQDPPRDDLGSKWLFQVRMGYSTRWFDLGTMIQTDETEWHVNPDETLSYDSFYARLYLEIFF